VYAVLAWRGLTGWLFPLTLLTVVGFTTLVLDRFSEGWFSFYVFVLPRQHEIAVEYLTQFWTADIARHLPLPAAAVLVWVATTLRRGFDRRSLFVCALLTGMVGASWFSRMHSGGTANVLLPAFAALALCGGLAMHDLVSRAEQRSRQAFALGLMVLGVAQFGLLYYSPWSQIPTRADREAGDALVALMRTVDGEVFLPFHGHLASLAGKPQHTHLVGIDDVLRGTNEEVKARLVERMVSALRTRRFNVIILDNVNTAWFRTSVHSRWFKHELDQAYARVGSVFEKPDVFIPVAGMRTRGPMRSTESRAVPTLKGVVLRCPFQMLQLNAAFHASGASRTSSVERRTCDRSRSVVISRNSQPDGCVTRLHRAVLSPLCSTQASPNRADDRPSSRAEPSALAWARTVAAETAAGPDGRSTYAPLSPPGHRPTARIARSSAASAPSTSRQNARQICR